MQAAFARALPENVYRPSKAPPRKLAKQATADEKQGSLQLDGGTLYFYDKGTLVPAGLTGKALARAKLFIPVRDAYQRVLDTMLARGTDAELTKAQRELKRTYDVFVSNFGHVNLRENERVIELDPNGGRILALEDVERVKRQKGRPAEVRVTGLAPFFTKRTLAPVVEPTTAENPADALTASLAWKGSVDLDYMQGLTGQTADALTTALEGRIFQDPVTQAWIARDEYLSGDVTTKLAQAAAAAQTDGRYAGNVAALTKVLPREFGPEDFTAPFGATWIPTATYEAFNL